MALFSNLNFMHKGEVVKKYLVIVLTMSQRVSLDCIMFLSCVPTL